MSITYTFQVKMETKDLFCKLLQKFDLLENELKCYITQCNK